MDPIKPEDITDELKQKLARQARLRHANGSMVAEIEAMGAVVDVANGRIDHMWLVLYHSGLLTAEQIISFQLDFEEDLRRTLQQGLTEMRSEYEKAQRKALENQRKQRLVVPESAKQGRRTLLVPGQGEVVIGEARPEGNGS